MCNVFQFFWPLTTTTIRRLGLLVLGLCSTLSPTWSYNVGIVESYFSCLHLAKFDLSQDDKESPRIETFRELERDSV